MESLVYRRPIDENRKIEKWLNDLRGKSGAYVFRDRFTGKTLYVGESHSGRLPQTIKRHFYAWNDKTDQFHFVCFPQDVEIAVRVTPQRAAKRAQNDLIARLRPGKNTIGVPDDPQPF